MNAHGAERKQAWEILGQLFRSMISPGLRRNGITSLVFAIILTCLMFNSGCIMMAVYMHPPEFSGINPRFTPLTKNLEGATLQSASLYNIKLDTSANDIANFTPPFGDVFQFGNLIVSTNGLHFPWGTDQTSVTVGIINGTSSDVLVDLEKSKFELSKNGHEWKSAKLDRIVDITIPTDEKNIAEAIVTPKSCRIFNLMVVRGIHGAKFAQLTLVLVDSATAEEISCQIDYDLQEIGFIM